MNNTHTATPSARVDLIDHKIETGQKFQAHEMNNDLRNLAIGYARNYSGTFSYMVDMSRHANDASDGNNMSDNMLKGVLNCLLAERRRNMKGPKAIAPIGFHLLNNEVYKVQANKAGTGQYAKVRSGNAWQYVGQVPGLSPATLLTLEQAKAIGHETGSCIICSRELSDPESIAQGIGPVCAKKFAA